PMNRFSNLVICASLCISLGFNTSTIMASTNTPIIGTNSNTSAIAMSKESYTVSKLKVVASFYPIFEFVKKVGGDRVEVSTLIPVGVEPHDFEPTIQQIQNAQRANMLVYNGAGFEGSWIKKINAKFVVDSSQGLNLTKNNSDKVSNSNDGRVDEHDTNEVAAEPVNPHVWLDPILAKKQVENIRDGLIKIDPNNAAYYSENARKFVAELDSLDASIRSELSDCEKREFISFHNAFNYLAHRYNLTQHSIHETISSAGEILPQRIQETIEIARTIGIDTIYSEDLLDPRLANVIAQEVPNGKVLILSPLEGIDQQEQKAGIGYVEKMKENIQNLKVGLKCK
ncbi:MAG TPA: zinc ABC transporter substrate-binding protein, partial [Nitrososphaeraceae archaeon]|nr:zinc ABC transporter substrate-binding protein [Nitrososphaeraceae archaeon]